ncbi:MAG: Type pilus biosis protein PilP [Myxococcaceae bacterium]|nr:Type pilus biosis protein PilP [Myxococcaceae bacterium]
MSHECAFPALVLALASLAACADPPAAPVAPVRVVTPLVAAPRTAPSTESPRAALAVAADLSPPRELRDPFRAYVPIFAVPVEVDGDQLLGQLTLADLRLLAVVSMDREPVAMVGDPSGFGTTLRRGMFVGRAEVIHRNDVDYAVRWRVARITASHLRRDADGRLGDAPAEVVFERADPTGEGLPSERTLTLAPAERGRLPGSFRLASLARR